KSTKPANGSNVRLTISALRLATSKSSRSTRRCLHNNSRGSSSLLHPANPTEPSAG
ncbi:hypothetical protein M9458_014843, partial [Cirrhinus mrigala]